MRPKLDLLLFLCVVILEMSAFQRMKYLGFCHSLNSGDFSPILQYTRRERTLVAASVPGPSAEKKRKKKKAFRAKAFSVKKVILWEAFISITVLMPFLNKTLHDYGIAYLHITLICKILYEFLVFGF